MATMPSCLRKECQHPSNKELNLQAVAFRTYEESLTQPLVKSTTHLDFLNSVGLTDFINLNWTHVHKDLAIEFLKNYRKKKKKSSTSTSLLSTVRDRKVVLSKKLIASTFKVSSKGYKHKDFFPSNDVVSSLFDPSVTKRKGFRIQDCKDPAFFERLEALNRLMNFKPPGHLVSTTLVDMIIHAGIQDVDWASMLLVSLMKELDRVTCSLHQSPSTNAGVHILQILTAQNIVTSQDRLVLLRVPFVLLDEYSTANPVVLASLRASPNGSGFASPRKMVHFHEDLESLSRHSSCLSPFPFVKKIWASLKQCFHSATSFVTERVCIKQ